MRCFIIFDYKKFNFVNIKLIFMYNNQKRLINVIAIRIQFEIRVSCNTPPLDGARI